MEYKQCYNCALRITNLLANKIKANELERSRDPIEIFDELDRQRAENVMRPELIDTGDKLPRKEVKRASLASTDASSRRNSNPPHSRSLSLSLSPSLPSSPSSNTLSGPQPIKMPKRKLPFVHQHNFARRRLPMTNSQEWLMSFPENTNSNGYKVSIPILRSHRILPGGGNSHRRKLPILDSIIENPRPYDHQPIMPSTQNKSVSCRVTKVSPSNESLPDSLLRVNCNLVAPRHLLIRTETETTYLTSSLGDFHQVT